MATLSISITGSTIVTGTKNYTVNDTNVQNVLDWARVNYATALSTAPTNQQILLAWVQGWINGTKDAVQRFETPAVVVPAPIDIS